MALSRGFHAWLPAAALAALSLGCSALLLLSHHKRRQQGRSGGLQLFKLANRAGMRVEVSDVGAAITRLIVPDAKGRQADVVLGYERPNDYLVFCGFENARGEEKSPVLARLCRDLGCYRCYSSGLNLI
jgi:hypothetical protein